MALTSFVANLTKITAVWLNKIDVLYVTIFGEAATKAAARAALTSDAPMAIGEGGTGATTASTARTALGSTSIGDSVFTAASAAAARSAVGAAASGANSDITSLSGITGLVDLSSATAGQVKFPSAQNPSADTNTLDDYEEGTWTPSVGGTATYSTQTGTYTKIGRLVFITCQLTIDVIGTGSTFIISGLPFNAGAPSPLSVANSQSLATALVSLEARASVGTVLLAGYTVAATAADTLAILGNGTSINVAGCYYV